MLLYNLSIFCFNSHRRIFFTDERNIDHLPPVHTQTQLEPETFLVYGMALNQLSHQAGLYSLHLIWTMVWGRQRVFTFYKCCLEMQVELVKLQFSHLLPHDSQINKDLQHLQKALNQSRSTTVHSKGIHKCHVSKVAGFVEINFKK